MNNESDKIWTYVVVTAFSTIAIACFILVISKLPNWGDKKPEWVAALGTIAAFAGTIWIATSERRQRVRSELDMATLSAAELYDRLNTYAGAIDGIALKLGPDGEVSPSVLRECQDWLCKLDLWAREEIEPLAVLPDHVAPRMQRVAIRRERMAKWMEELASAKNIGFRKHRYGTLRSDLVKCQNDLTRCRAQLAKLLKQIYTENIPGSAHLG